MIDQVKFCLVLIVLSYTLFNNSIEVLRIFFLEPFNVSEGEHERGGILVGLRKAFMKVSSKEQYFPIHVPQPIIMKDLYVYMATSEKPWKIIIDRNFHATLQNFPPYFTSWYINQAPNCESRTLNLIIIHSKYFPDSDWLKAHP